MEGLKKQLAPIKGGITKIQNWYNDNITQNDVYQFELKLKKIDEFYAKYELLLELIEEVDDANLKGECDIMEGKYCVTASNLKRKIDELKGITPATSAWGGQHVPSVKLPEISVTPFSGCFTEWNAFSELFHSLIVHNPSLTNVQKFIYLKSYLKGEPLELINSLPLTSDNFLVALDTLKDRYENEFRIINSHIKKLIDVQVLTKSSASDIRKFITQAKQGIQSLTNLKIPKEEWADLMLIYMYIQKLDFNTVRAFESERKPKKRPSLQEFFEFLDKRCSVMETVSVNFPSKPTQQNSKNFHSKTSHHLNAPGRSNFFDANRTQGFNCPCCNQPSHRISQCEKFKNWPVQQRFAFVKDKKLCRNCLSSIHSFEACSSPRTCLSCHQRHHTLLHNSNVSNAQFRPENNNNQFNQQNAFNSNARHVNTALPQPPSYDEQQEGRSSLRPPIPLQQNPAEFSQAQPSRVVETTIAYSAVNRSENETLLATALVTLYSTRGERIVARALLDNGSQISIMTKALVKELRCRTFKRNMQISSISNQFTHSHEMANISIFSTLQNNKEFPVACIILDEITCNLPRFRINTSTFNIPSEITLADPKFFQSQPIDLLLGMDVYGDLLCNGMRKLGRGLPVLINTYLGWTLSGTVPIQQTSRRTLGRVSNNFIATRSPVSLFTQTVNPDDRADLLIQKFWLVEEVPERALKSADEELAEKIFQESTIRLNNGRFQVNLPLKSPEEHFKLGDSFSRASKRFYALETKLNKNKELHGKYSEFIHEYISLGHAKEVAFNKNSEQKYFLPHHCVIREDSITTKLRVVFDASMKTSTDYSLNDIMLKGWTVQPDLFDILCRFRTSHFVCTADIEKMFRQILVNPNQTFLQNILWRDGPQEKLKCLELQTITYGTNSAPYLSTRCLIELAKLGKTLYPLAAEALQSQCYVDDVLYGCDSKQELLDAHSQLTELLGSVGMALHKWCSNSQEFLQTISREQCHDKYVIKSESNTSKVLGLTWDPSQDRFAITPPKENLRETATKRQVLSTIAQVFDPIGLINPFIVIAKILMQKIWLTKTGWDEQLNPTLLKEWQSFLGGIAELKNLKIPRNLFTQEKHTLAKIEIHSFSDASIKCYGACVYLRTIYKNGDVSCNLITSKSRIAPIKQITLPRLELSGAVLMAKLTNKIISVFANKFSCKSVHLWTDSEIVLSWVKSHPSRWSVFVANRVSEIQTLTPTCQWHHIRSANNPADILSRGSMPHNLINSNLWWHGPCFLQSQEVNWKNFEPEIRTSDVPEERKAEKTVTLLHKADNDLYETLLNYYSSFRKIQRVMAYCLRACKNFKIKNDLNEKLTGPLSVEELREAEKTIVNIIQEKFFTREIQDLKKSKPLSHKSMKNLSLVLDEFEMIRVGGRLFNANIAYEHKHPLLLPSKNRVVRLLLHREHIRLCHAGAQTVLANIRLRYWPIDGLREVKGVVRQCKTCFRFRARPASQIMADLPKERVLVTRPFLNVGVDFGGPFLIKPSKLRSRTTIKCYLAMFVCMTTRAVHLELVSSLTSEDFLQTLRRFIGRRGNPSVIYSDNATNFQGANNKLKELFTFFKDNNNLKTIQNYLADTEITWKFIPARSPHWGGLWEAAIKSAKHHLLRVKGETLLSFEELNTVLIDIEAIMNSRPLCPLSNDPHDVSCLTPGHFLIGAPLVSIPDKDVANVSENRLNRWQRCVQISQSFWKRWTTEYLHCLQKRAKWLTPQKNLEIGDLVLLTDDFNHPLKWPLARIVETFPGHDNKVRAVKVLTKDGTFTRSVTKLCPLPKDADEP